MHQAGDLVGPYRLVAPLGAGAMGEVWRAHDERLDRFVALKVLPPEAADNLERRARQLREARAAAAINHRSVVTLYDIVAHEGEDILVMELVEGRTLSDALKLSGPPPLAQALRWIINIADALAAAHARGILHRDIKAANIMVTADDTIKVLDFGLAKLRDDEPHPSASQSFPPVKALTSGLSRKLALDETMVSASDKAQRASRQSLRALELDSYKTHAGQLLGTPIYMAPEQITGDAPDERTEVFSTGVLAYEILSGKPPYTATSIDDLFAQITNDTPAPIANVPDAVNALLARALEKEPAQRIPTMAALRDAFATEARPKRRTWPLVTAIAVIALAAVGVALYALRPPSPLQKAPGDEQVDRALAEYDMFYGDKALSSLRSALAIAPNHARANAYMILFGGASEADQHKAAAKAHEDLPASRRDRALLAAAAALVERGPRAAHEVLARAPVNDRELAFWSAELQFRAGDYASSGGAYKALLANPATTLRGRIYDHYSAVLLYLDKPKEAAEIGALYRDAFPGEADAVGVYATTLSAIGKHDEAVAAAEQAYALAEGEDTLAGLAKVLTVRNQGDDRKRAAELYRQSYEQAKAGRRPLRLAALGLLQFMASDATRAAKTVAPCLPGSGAPESTARERGACLFVAALVDPSKTDVIANELDAMQAQATPVTPAYGAPASLATLVRAREVFFAGGCMIGVDVPDGVSLSLDTVTYDVPLDFYAAYHLPLFAGYADCEKRSWAENLRR